MLKKTCCGLLLLVGIMLLSLPASLRAQATTGTILGSVTDKTGAAVPGAHMTITDVNKGTRQTYETDPGGAFYAPFLIPETTR